MSSKRLRKGSPTIQNANPRQDERGEAGPEEGHPLGPGETHDDEEDAEHGEAEAEQAAPGERAERGDEQDDEGESEEAPLPQKLVDAFAQPQQEGAGPALRGAGAGRAGGRGPEGRPC